MENTFWNDFSIADVFGLDAIQDTFDRAFNEWKGDYKMLTELVMVLNHKIWQHNETCHTAYMNLYYDLWEKADNYALDHLKGRELSYFLEVIN